MTGKELMLALVGAGLVGGGAGAAASFATAPKPPTQDVAAESRLAERLQAAETQLAEAKASLEASRKSVNELTERVTAAEMKSAKRDAELAAAPAPSPDKRPGRGFKIARGGKADEKAAADMAGEFATALGAIDIDGLTGDVGVEIGKALEGVDLGGAAEQFAALRSGLELRRLPEDKRWEKAKDDLGLTWNQVEDLKKAVADRDAAMKAATVSEKKTGPNGGAITIMRPDAGKAAHAQADYHDKLNGTLSEDQRKGWTGKGYDGAFGQGGLGMGGSMVMTVGVSADKVEKTGEAPK
jgi:hypothetical protein